MVTGEQVPAQVPAQGEQGGGTCSLFQWIKLGKGDKPGKSAEMEVL